MGTFTPLHPADIDSICLAFSLGAVESCTPIAAGTVNSNFAFVTERGRFFVRINEGKCEDDVRWEAELVAALAAQGVPTPTPLVALTGRPYAALGGKWVSGFPWLDGVHKSVAELTPADTFALGNALATLHLVGAERATLHGRPSRYNDADLAARRQHIAAAADPLLSSVLELLVDEANQAQTAQAIRNAATQGIIHGDLFRDNVLFARSQPARVVALLDFEQAFVGSVSYDLAVCLNDWCWDEQQCAPLADLAHALLAGYQTVRPLLPPDLAALPYELRAAAARFTTTRITDVYLAKITNGDKDFRAFSARLLGWRTGAVGQLIGPV